MESQECSPIGICVFTPNASGPSDDDGDDDNNSVMCLGVCVPQLNLVRINNTIINTAAA